MLIITNKQIPVVLISSKESRGFDVVLGCLVEGAHGTLRTGRCLNGQKTIYSINDKEIPCGSIGLKI